MNGEETRGELMMIMGDLRQHRDELNDLWTDRYRSEWIERPQQTSGDIGTWDNVCVGGGVVEITVDEWVERQIGVSDCWKPSQYEDWEEGWWVMRDSSEVRETCVCGIEECGWFVWVLVMVVVYWWCGNSWMMMWYVRRDLMIIVCVSVERVGMIGVVEWYWYEMWWVRGGM